MDQILLKKILGNCLNLYEAYFNITKDDKDFLEFIDSLLLLSKEDFEKIFNGTDIKYFDVLKGIKVYSYSKDNGVDLKTIVYNKNGNIPIENMPVITLRAGDDNIEVNNQARNKALIELKRAVQFNMINIDIKTK